MISKIKEKLISEKVGTRIIWLTITFTAVFFSITILSYFLLPEGFLLRKNSVADFKTSENLFICAVQIFLYNMMSVAFIILGSLFAQKKEGEKNYRSYGYTAFYVFTALNAITLGTWSFTANVNSIPLTGRIFRTFDIVHNAGMLEMYGQLLITSAFATKYLVMTEGKHTTARKISDLKIEKSEIVTLICGFLLMMLGALVESHAIAG